MKDDTGATDTGDCCADGHDAPALKLDVALARILADVRPVDGVETVPVREALGRVLAGDVVSQIDVPSHTNSAMDGYAVRAADLPGNAKTRLDLVGVAAAGRPFDGAVAPGQCVRILTGAPLPDGADTVVMQERVTREGDAVIVGAGQEPGQHVRQAGEDIARGDVALTAGTLLMPAALGMLASVGVGKVDVLRRARVAFFSTGDELRRVGEPLDTGQIYDSNGYTIHGMLTRAGVEVIDMGLVRDDPADIESAFLEAAARADAIVTSGGVSVGDADYVKDTLEKMGSVGFWRVSMKPGRPLAFGRIGDALFFGLPGNPVSAMVTFYQLVQPALRALAGLPESGPPLTVTAVSRERLRKKTGRREFQRGVLARDAEGRLFVTRAGQQGSGVLSSMNAANCFIVLPEEAGPVAPGDEVTVQPFSAFI